MLAGDMSLICITIVVLVEDDKLQGSHAIMPWLGFVPTEGIFKTLCMNIIQFKGSGKHMLAWYQE